MDAFTAQGLEFNPLPGARKQRAGKAVYGAEGRLPNVDRFDSALSLHLI